MLAFKLVLKLAFFFPQTVDKPKFVLYNQRLMAAMGVNNAITFERKGGFFEKGRRKRRFCFVFRVRSGDAVGGAGGVVAEVRARRQITLNIPFDSLGNIFALPCGFSGIPDSFRIPAPRINRRDQDMFP